MIYRALALILLISLIYPVEAEQQPPLVVVEWLEPVVDAQSLSGTVRYFKTDELPQPPLFVREEKGNQVQVLLRQLGGIYWIPRHTVRLNNETALQLVCQNNLKSRQSDYRNYGMRGKADEQVSLHCINETPVTEVTENEN